MKIVIILLNIVAFLVIAGNAFGTPQRPDILIYEGKEYPIYNEPLEIFFKKNPERRPKFCGGVSSLWRGYVAVIEVVKKELILKDVKIHTVNPMDPTCLQESKLSEGVPVVKNLSLTGFQVNYLRLMASS